MALKQTIKNHSANSFLGLMLLGLVGVSSFNFFHTRAPDPYTELKAKALSPAVEYGEPLLYEVSGVRNRLCGIIVARGYVSLETGVMVHQEFVPAGFTALGPFRVPISAALPKHMGPGRYVMRGLQTNDCGSEVFITPYPDLSFEVVKHKSNLIDEAVK